MENCNIKQYCIELCYLLIGMQKQVSPFVTMKPCSGEMASMDALVNAVFSKWITLTHTHTHTHTHTYIHKCMHPHTHTFLKPFPSHFQINELPKAQPSLKTTSAWSLCGFRDSFCCTRETCTLSDGSLNCHVQDGVAFLSLNNHASHHTCKNNKVEQMLCQLWGQTSILWQKRKHHLKTNLSLSLLHTQRILFWIVFLWMLIPPVMSTTPTPFNIPLPYSLSFTYSSSGNIWKKKFKYMMY